jgi:hypothetical protein
MHLLVQNIEVNLAGISILAFLPTSDYIENLLRGNPIFILSIASHNVSDQPRPDRETMASPPGAALGWLAIEGTSFKRPLSAEKHAPTTVQNQSQPPRAPTASYRAARVSGTWYHLSPKEPSVVTGDP